MPCKLAISSVSLGRCSAGHRLEDKLEAASLHGYQGIELFYEEITHIARTLPGGLTRDNELKAARTIARLCKDRQLEIICLQPFWNYEGLLDRQEHAGRLEELSFWFSLAKILGTETILIPSNFLPPAALSGDTALAVADLREAADMGLREQPPIRFAYEALCWGTYWDLWEQSWELVKAVDRPNFGLCLDTFKIAGRIYADPTSPAFFTPNGDEAIRASLERLVSTVDVSRVFSIQITDAERLTQPLIAGHELHEPNQPPRMSWSRSCRLFYGEQDRGACLPIAQIAQALFQSLGFEGWVSMALFNKRMTETDKDVPWELAHRGEIAWRKLVQDMELRVEVTAPNATSTSP